MSRCPFSPDFGKCLDDCALKNSEYKECRIAEYCGDVDAIEKRLGEIDANLVDIAAMISTHWNG